MALAQQAELPGAGPGAVPLPDAAALDMRRRGACRRCPAADWPRDAAWRGVLHGLLAACCLRRPRPCGPCSSHWREADDDLALSARPTPAAWGVGRPGHGGRALCRRCAAGATGPTCCWRCSAPRQRRRNPFGRIDDPGLCPCCGSRPTASLTRSSGESLGQRYLHCSLCNFQWHLNRGRCSHCGDTKSVAYQSLDTAEAGSEATDADEAAASRAAKAVVQAETCDACGSYLKIVHSDRDPFVDPVADDLASLTLDLLVSETGKARSGVNVMLLFGPAEPPGGAG
jgi:FdhE protein